jgi:hypothetical protein
MHWLCDVLGLEGWAGDSVHARICVELVDDPTVSDPGEHKRRAAADAEQTDGEPSEEQEEQTSVKEEPDERHPT